MSAIRHVLAAGTPANRLLRFSLGLLATALVLLAARNLLVSFPRGVDLEIPLRAAARWVKGAPPYLPDSFRVRSGVELPYLYPPFILPVLAPMLSLPRAPLLAAWSLVCLAAAVFSCRRLGLPWRILPIALLWPPFLEGILGGNIQIVLFAAFVAAFWPPRAVAMHGPREQDHGRLGFVRGLMAASVGVLKVSQIHAWILALRLDVRGAVLGASALACLMLASLPITGLQIYGDWLGQLARAADPTWTAGGVGLGKFLPTTVVGAIGILSVLLVLAVPRKSAATWAGILLVAGSPSLHSFGWLFLLPAMLAVRREIALVAAFYLASYDPGLYWIAFTLVAGAFLLGNLRPAFLERRPGIPAAAVAGRLPQPAGREGGLDPRP